MKIFSCISSQALYSIRALVSSLIASIVLYYNVLRSALGNKSRPGLDRVDGYVRERGLGFLSNVAKDGYRILSRSDVLYGHPVVVEANDEKNMSALSAVFSWLVPVPSSLSLCSPTLLDRV